MRDLVVHQVYATIWNHAPVACNLLHEMNNALDC